MNIETLASKVKFLDQQYREGKATVSDAVFDKLENNSDVSLQRITNSQTRSDISLVF